MDSGELEATTVRFTGVGDPKEKLGSRLDAFKNVGRIFSFTVMQRTEANFPHHKRVSCDFSVVV